MSENAKIKNLMEGSLKVKIAKSIPPRILNCLLLLFPFLYETRFINFESYSDDNGLKELLKGLEDTKKIPGNIIECGCARCGTSVILARYLKANNIKKKVYSLDSFEGFDPKELKKEKKDGFTKADSNAFSYNSYEYVIKKIRKLGVSDILFPIKGFFQQTLPKVNSDFCMGFIDCDLSESITYTAETVWSRLSNNGFLFFDDYGFENFQGVKPAVDEFIKKHQNEIAHHGLLKRLYYVEKN